MLLKLHLYRKTLYFKEKKAGEIKICAFLDKKAKRRKDIRFDYVGFGVPDKFVCGYGIDYNQKYRELNYIGVLNQFNLIRF
jgi:hypoxanthine phosphoribosyltransferase